MKCSATSNCPVIDAPEFSWSRSLYHEGGYPYFKKYKFSQEIPLDQGVSGFDVEVIDTAKDGSVVSKMYTNGGKGFPFDDTIVTQPLQTCNGRQGNGSFNITVAVRIVTNSASKGTANVLICSSCMMIASSTRSRPFYNTPTR